MAEKDLTEKQIYYGGIRAELAAAREEYAKFVETGFWPETENKWQGIRSSFSKDKFFLTPDELIIQSKFEQEFPGLEFSILAPELVKAEILFRSDPNNPFVNPVDRLIGILTDQYPAEAKFFYDNGITNENLTFEEVLSVLSTVGGLSLIAFINLNPYSILTKIIITLIGAYFFGWGSGLYFSTDLGRQKIAAFKQSLDSAEEIAEKAGDVASKAASAVLDPILKYALIGGAMYLTYKILSKSSYKGKRFSY